MDFALLEGTTNVGLVYEKHKNTIGSVVKYVDSDYARDLDERMSLTRYIFTLGGCIIS